ncbi:LysR family transcriptional regulator [Ideonella sp. DXS22W]|uniref:LysR family transcriptional regulator n=1 Tax=Pseudaquabacterium inlustre TaxID=2984192 RepID=A0ABU9CDZ2_9BURK
MDKLRAITYFVAAAECGSLTAAARRLGVSAPAVLKLIGTLEAALGVPLLERHAKGVHLTPAGSDYLDCCRPLLEELGAAEAALQHSALRPSGTLVVAIHEQLAHHILLPAMHRLRGRFPELQIDFRTVHRLSDADAQDAEVLLLHGWPEAPASYVHRRLGMTRSLVLASPDYWAAHGVPESPEALAGHTCVMMRNPAGIVIDLWEFRRGDEQRSVRVNGWLVSNAREVVLSAILRGQGVARLNEVTTRTPVRTGQLVPVLTDWDVQGGPPINLLYPASARRNPRVRVFIDFALQVLEQHGSGGERTAASTERPAWHRSGYGRASATVRPRER